MCNIGGLLTPLGDPPLFLGFLRGVDFFWTLRLFPQWAMTVGLVLLVYAVFEVRAYRREPARAVAADRAEYVPIRILGMLNVLFLAGVIVRHPRLGAARRRRRGDRLPLPARGRSWWR